MATKFRFSGGKDLEKALAALDKAATRKATGRRALKKAADPILKSYQSRTVVKTGTLVGNEISGTRLNRRQSRLNRKIGKSEVEVHIGTADPAGIQQEFGNVNQAASPALTPAWDAEGGQKAVDRIGDEMWIDIDKTTKRQARRAR